MNKLNSKISYALISFVLLVSAFSPLRANGPELLYGEWGTDAQCSGEILVPGGTKRAAPFKILADWLNHGDSWCRLSWLNVSEKPDGVTALAQALCGEDSVRGYRINFELVENTLNIRWGVSLVNGPLLMCSS